MPFSGYGDLNGDFSGRLQAFIAASGGRISITSGYRSPERQAELFRAAVAKYGSEQAARKWVAPPGKSNHGKGIAADLGFSDASARQWAHANAARFGLHFPMSWEPWHIEPAGAVDSADRDAYTTPQPGHAHPHDVAVDPHDPSVQFTRLMGAMLGTGGSEMDSPSQEVVDSPAGVVEGPGTEIESQLSEAAGAMSGAAMGDDDGP